MLWSAVPNYCMQAPKRIGPLSLLWCTGVLLVAHRNKNKKSEQFKVIVTKQGKFPQIGTLLV